ncbi:MAG: triacylglycerol lipase [Firmicutes bacterium]|nr:triacylglycerol lipase [Bacillota bacterium]
MSAFIVLTLLILPHFAGITYFIFQFLPLPVLWFILFSGLCLFAFIRLFIFPNKRQAGETTRLYAMHGGEIQLSGCFLCQIMQIFLYFILIKKCGISHKSGIFMLDLVLTLVFIWSVGMSGIIRVILTSSWLSVVKRVMCIILLHIPVIGLFAMVYMARTSALEYEYFSYKIKEKRSRKSDSCKTKYPIIMVHGLGFRDLHYFNYWGRIPKALEENGALIYYGHQEAWGDIAHNAEDLCNTAKLVLEETGAKKVNIIAHSKGGLDARYAISKLGLGEYTASLTTIGTPHRGSVIADLVKKLPKPIFKIAEYCINSMFLRYGDTRPDFGAAADDLTTAGTEQFNKNCPDFDGVYYQSYTSVLKGFFSDKILALPYMIMKAADSCENDGMVSVESAKWGEYRGTITNKYLRGISHGDIIDLKREDFRGFDVAEKYIEIVSELKNMGF